MPADGLTSGDTNIRSGDNASSGSAESESQLEYIVIESADENGEWSQQFRIGYPEAKALMTDAIQEANNQQVEIVQGIASDNQEFQTMAITISIVLVFALFAVLGSVAVDTLVRSFEVRR